MPSTITHPIDKSYMVALLLGCIDILSRELAVKVNLDPEVIANKTLLDMCLQLHYQGTEKILSSLEAEYGYGSLIDRLDEIIGG